MIATFKPGMLMGLLANGQELGQGSRIHAVPAVASDYSHATAACGARPGRRSAGWDVTNAAGKAITCPRCIRVEAKSRSAS